MRIAYAFRRGTLYPAHAASPTLPAGDMRTTFLRKARAIGFDAVEIGLENLEGGATEAAARTLRAQIEDAGLACAAIRAGGGFVDPRSAAQSRKNWRNGIEVAVGLGAPVVNGTVTTPVDPNQPGNFVGEAASQNSSRTARGEDFELTAKEMRDIAGTAADHGVEIAIEIHQHSIADNSKSMLRLLNLIDRPNVGVNPDLGNIYWCYDIPEESCEDAIVALAPRAKYWHCKNLIRAHVPDVKRSIFLQRSLPEGEIDYRFALSAMVTAGYQGAIAIEGIRLGDQWLLDARSVEYVKSLSS